MLIPFRCIFNERKESRPWKVRPSTVLILFLFSSLKQNISQLENWLSYSNSNLNRKTAVEENLSLTIHNFDTHKNWRWGSLKTLGGIMLIRLRFNFTTNKEPDKLSKQPASKVVILLLLKFLKWQSSSKRKETVITNQVCNSGSNSIT